MKRIVLDSVDSTNTYAENNANSLTENTLIIAKDQTNGHGQHNREWFSELGKSITLSFLLRDLPREKIQQIPSIISTTLNELYAINSEVVLPNDIYVNDKKICGLLIETYLKSNTIDYAIIGIGLNLNNDAFPEYLSNKASSVKIITGKTENSDLFVEEIEKRMEALYA